ncbi:MAG: PrsW family intramembrane metalloprotease [Lachnospiraceae bacterium]|nr:PrsW family intramembrane metalloprotease [Lachnospiraceae bacterium]
MALFLIVQFVVCIFILKWTLKQKPGERFSKKSVAKFLGFGALSVVVVFVCFGLVVDKESFSGQAPILYGFLTAFCFAAVPEELGKYLFFRLAIAKNREVDCWLSAIIAAITVGAGFTLLEDVEFVVSGAGSFVRAFLPCHLIFQLIMGYFYGKACVTKEKKYHVLSICVPIVCHTLFDMFLVAMKPFMKAVLKMQESGELPSDMIKNPEKYADIVKNIPHYNETVVYLICSFVVFVVAFVALIVLFSKLGKWNKNGEKLESLS